MNLRQGSMSVQEYSLKFNTLSKYAPMLVADLRARMNMFISGVSDLINECQTALLIKDMNLARLMIYVEQIEKKKLHKWKKGEAKRPRYDGGYQGHKGDDGNRNNQIQKFQQQGSSNVNQRYANDRVQNNKGQQGRGGGAPTYPKCQKCRKNHGGVCYRETGTCFACGQLGHKISNCPKARDKGKGVRPQGKAAQTGQKSQGVQQDGAPRNNRFYALHGSQEVEDEPNVVMGMLKALNWLPAFDDPYC